MYKVSLWEVQVRHSERRGGGDSSGWFTPRVWFGGQFRCLSLPPEAVAEGENADIDRGLSVRPRYAGGPGGSDGEGGGERPQTDGPRGRRASGDGAEGRGGRVAQSSSRETAGGGAGERGRERTLSSQRTSSSSTEPSSRTPSLSSASSSPPSTTDSEKRSSLLHSLFAFSF